MRERTSGRTKRNAMLEPHSSIASMDAAPSALWTCTSSPNLTSYIGLLEPSTKYLDDLDRALRSLDRYENVPLRGHPYLPLKSRTTSLRS